MILQRRHILWLFILVTAGLVVVDCHNLHVAVSTDDEHNMALGSHGRALAARPLVHRQDEPAKLSLGMVASQQSPLPFHPAINSTSAWIFGNSRRPS